MTVSPARVLQFIEIDVDYCSLTYSISPCLARLDGAADAASSDAVLLLSGNGADASTTFPDESPIERGNAVVNGNVQVDTAQFQFGTGSILFDGSGDFLTFAHSDDWEFGAGSFTIDWYERRSAAAIGKTAISRDATSTFAPFILGYDDNTGSLDVYITSNGASFDIANAKNLGTFTVDVWSHRAIARDGTTFYLFKDGVITDTWTSSAAIFASANPLSIGRTQGFLDFSGHMEQIRITKGRALWTANFTPPLRELTAFTGTKKCFNTIATCQDRENFTNVPVTLRFAVPTLEMAQLDTISIPNIKTIEFDPATISLGKDLGQRATLTVNFDDHRHSDTGEGYDKYLADSPSPRDYDPYLQGTYWGKFAARQPFLRGRPLRWIVGFAGQSYPSEYETRHYVIDSFSGPTNSGVFKLIAKDLLKLADGDRAMAPAVSQGYLVSDITNSATAFTLSPSGIGDLEYPASGYVAIGGSEIVSFTRSGDAMTITRAQLGTAASAHSAQDRAQLVLRYSAVSPEIIIADLLENYAGVDSSYIPLAAWTTEVQSHLNRLYTATIAQPTAVNTLISELIEQAGLSMWWDDREQEIGLLVLRGLIYTNYLFSQDNMQADTLDISEQPDKRLSQVHTYFGQINPLTSLTDKANYRSSSVIIDEQSEEDYGSAMIKEIFSRWIPALGRTIADRLGEILIGRFKDPPRKLKFAVLRNSIPEVILAQGYQAQAWPLQLDTGEPETVNLQVTRLRPSPDLIEVEAEEVLFTAPDEDLTVRRIIVDANIHDINLRTAHDALFPPPTGGITVVLTVNAGVILGSTTELSPALTIGDWPSGVTIVVHVAGRIQGHGGTGGSGSHPTIQNGNPGGTAIYSRQAIQLSSVGQIWGGGGGGGYGVSIIVGGFGQAWGGSGGAGFDPGIGGQGTQGASNGQSGTTESGGGGNNLGGAGGPPGTAGNPGVGSLANSSGGAAGNSIDGISFCTTGSWDGTTFTPGALGGLVAGPQIN